MFICVSVGLTRSRLFVIVCALVVVNYYYSIRAIKCSVVYRIHCRAGSKSKQKIVRKTVSFGCVFWFSVESVCDAKPALSICSESSSGPNKSVSLVLRIHSHSSVRSTAAADCYCFLLLLCTIFFFLYFVFVHACFGHKQRKTKENHHFRWFFYLDECACVLNIKVDGNVKLLNRTIEPNSNRCSFNYCVISQINRWICEEEKNNSKMIWSFFDSTLIHVFCSVESS